MKKKILLMALILAVAIGAAVYCLVQTDWFFPAASADAADFGAAATEYALNAGTIGENELLIADTLETDGSGTHVDFVVFSVAEGYDPGDFRDYDMARAVAAPELTQVGTATASFVGGKPENIRNLKIIHTS